MEKDLKQKTLSFNKGVCLSPSEMSCDDNELSVCDGLLFERGELHVIQSPKDKGWSVGAGMTLVGVHDYAEYTHLIFKGTSNNEEMLWWAKKIEEGSQETFSTTIMTTEGLGGFRKMEAFGNTIAVSTDSGMRYFLWTNGGYKDLGGQLPDIEMELKLEDVSSQLDIRKQQMDIHTFIDTDNTDTTGEFTIKIDNDNDFQNAVIGLIAKTRNIVKEKGFFAFPFWVRAGIRMYDETVVSLTAPIIMYAAVRANHDIYGRSGSAWAQEGTLGTGLFYYNIQASGLRVKIKDIQNLFFFRDLINDVVIYISEETPTFLSDGKWKPMKEEDRADGYILRDKVVGAAPAYSSVSVTSAYPATQIIPERKLADKGIIKALIEKSVFYELVTFDIERLYNEMNNDESPWYNMEDEMQYKALLNLTTRTQLPHDDFYGHCQLSAETMFAYNGRLQLGNIRRSIFNGFTLFSNFKTTARTMDIYVTIKVNDGEGDRVVKHQGVEYDEYLWHWFFYPDRRAKKVMFVYNNVVTSYTMREHPYLNGAYHFAALPNIAASLPSDASAEGYVVGDTAPTVANQWELLPSTVATSEVNNPWYFPADGWNTVGSGKVVALSSTTDALSEGQFGVFPLLAFTDEGVWALSLRKDGLYDTTAPISREVCLDGKSVVQTDDAVYFISEKGLMRVSGRTVKCVSEQLDGKECVFNYWQDGKAEKVSYDIPSVSMNKNTRIAYDYKFGRLWMYKDGVQGVLVYSLKTGAFATLSEWSLQSHAVLYPDTLIQDSNGTIWSMLGTKDENEDEETYDVQFLSRPVKMGDLLHFKSMRRVEHHALLSSGADAEFKMWGSDDLREWFLLDGFRGRGWKYFRFGVTIEGMNAVDVYAGMTTNYLERQTGRLHGETIINNE